MYGFLPAIQGIMHKKGGTSNEINVARRKDVVRFGTSLYYHGIRVCIKIGWHLVSPPGGVWPACMIRDEMYI